MTGILTREREQGNRRTHGGNANVDNRGRDWNNTFTGQGTPRLASNHHELGEKHGTGPLSQPSEGLNTGDILISDF